jgi:single-strand DNA-binding protein
MTALNRVQLIGRLRQDPENRYTPTGKYVARFSLAVSNRWNSGEGESKESAEWLQHRSLGKAGRNLPAVSVQSLVLLEDRLKTDKVDDKSGETKYYSKLVAQSMQMLDHKPEEEPVSTVEDEAGEYEP